MMKVVYKETNKYIRPTSKREIYAIIDSSTISGQVKKAFQSKLLPGLPMLLPEPDGYFILLLPRPAAQLAACSELSLDSEHIMRRYSDFGFSSIWFLRFHFPLSLYVFLRLHSLDIVLVVQWYLSTTMSSSLRCGNRSSNLETPLLFIRPFVSMQVKTIIKVRLCRGS